MWTSTRPSGNGLREATVEDVFDLCENVVARVARGPVPEQRRARMRTAVQNCPVSALRIEDNIGVADRVPSGAANKLSRFHYYHL
jgi:ferredoxin